MYVRIGRLGVYIKKSQCVFYNDDQYIPFPIYSSSICLSIYKLKCTYGAIQSNRKCKENLSSMQRTTHRRLVVVSTLTVALYDKLWSDAIFQRNMY
jgi:hypothetical protein